MATGQITECDTYESMKVTCLRNNVSMFNLWATEIDFRDRNYVGMGEPVPTSLHVLREYCEVYDLEWDDFEKLKLIDKTAYIERSKIQSEKRKVEKDKVKNKNKAVSKGHRRR